MALSISWYNFNLHFFKRVIAIKINPAHMAHGHYCNAITTWVKTDSQVSQEFSSFDWSDTRSEKKRKSKNIEHLKCKNFEQEKLHIIYWYREREVFYNRSILFGIFRQLVKRHLFKSSCKGLTCNVNQHCNDILTVQNRCDLRIGE